MLMALIAYLPVSIFYCIMGYTAELSLAYMKYDGCCVVIPKFGHNAHFILRNLLWASFPFPHS